MSAHRSGKFFIGAAVAAAALLVASPLFAQAKPVSGTVVLSLLPAGGPPSATAFSVDLGIDITGATGSCTKDGATVPMTLGAYQIGIQYDSTKLKYTSVASCGTHEFANPLCSASGEFVNCNDTNVGNTDQPQGKVCVAHLTFTRLAAGPLGAIRTVHVPNPRGVASGLVVGCGGPATFDAVNIVDATAEVTAVH